MRFRFSQGVLCLMIALIFIPATRLPYVELGACDPDEAVGAMVGQAILEGGIPYVDAIDHRGPLSYYFFATVFAIAGPLNMFSIHIALMLMIMSMAILIYRIGTHAFSEQVAGWATLLFAILSWTGKPTDMLAAHTEWLMAFFTLLGLWVWLRKDETRMHFALLGGMCMGIAALSKQVAVWEWLVFPLGMGLLAQRGSLPWPVAIRQAFVAGLGFALPLLLVMLMYSLLGEWDAFFTYAWQYNVDIYMPVLGVGRRLRNTWELLLGFSIGKSLLLGLSVAGGGMLARKELGKIQTLLPPAQLIMGVWVALAIAGSLTGGRNFGHYLIQALPGLALLGGFALGEIQRLGQDSFLLKPLLIALLGFGVVYPPIAAYGLLYRPWLEVEESLPAHSLVNYLEDQPGESLFVWGFSPYYYVETGLQPVSRFLYTTYQTGVVPIENAHMEETAAFSMPGSWDMLMQELTEGSPDFVIDASGDNYSFMEWHPMSRYPRLQTWLDAHYTLDSTYQALNPSHGVLLYRKK